MTRWLTIECMSGDHESCLGRNCSTEQDQVCECSCHLAKQGRSDSPAREQPAGDGGCSWAGCLTGA